jgi:hypothetical protein
MPPMESTAKPQDQVAAGNSHISHFASVISHLRSGKLAAQFRDDKCSICNEKCKM